MWPPSMILFIAKAEIIQLSRAIASAGQPSQTAACSIQLVAGRLNSNPDEPEPPL